MTTEYYECGSTIEPSSLENQSAIEFLKAIKDHSYAELLRAVKQEENEGFEFNIKPEIPKNPINDIHKSERICILFPKYLNKQPKVFALRKDFPSNLQHLNLTNNDNPKSLCLFQQDYRELNRNMTSKILLDRIFSWLSRAAVDEQHEFDQPLEPFLMVSETVIFDPDIFGQDHVDKLLIGIQLSEEPRCIYRVQSIPATISDTKLPKPPCFITIPIITRPWQSRLINQTPTSVEELAVLLNKVEVKLIDILQKKTIEIFQKTNENQHKIILDYFWMFLIRLPKTRKQGGTIESTEDWAFFSLDKIGSLACKLGVLEIHNKTWARCIGEYALSDLDSSLIITLRTIHSFNRNMAMKLADTYMKKKAKITAVGAGALGSHVILNLARQGIGTWSIIDEDQVLPHNNARIALPPGFDGAAKAEILAQEINTLLSEEEAAKGFVVDILDQSLQNDDVLQRLKETDHILDCSVSTAVSRHLALMDTDIPITSLFLLQKGRYLVILSEGIGRKVRLDDIEVQLAVESIENAEVRNLFNSHVLSQIRYSGACRDVTTILPQGIVATQSGIASQFFMNNIKSDQPSIDVWELSEQTLTIRRTTITPYPVRVFSVGNWEVRLSQHAIDIIKTYRHSKLPNETGGVLLGCIDVLAKIVYVGSILPSPSDSTEWPTVYIRGIKDLKKRIEFIKSETSGNLIYVGEWHSHPGSSIASPSDDDLRAHSWLSEIMSEEGYPGVMLIQGGKGEPCILLGNM